jgi:hypothetical protein
MHPRRRQQDVMFAATEHPFHIQTIAFFSALLPIAALFALMFAESLVRRHRRAHRRSVDT